MAEFFANESQVVDVGQTIVFTDVTEACNRGFIRHRNGSGNFLLSGWTPYSSCGCRNNSANYLVDFGANIGIPTTGTVGAISLAISLDGSTIPSSTMIVTPAAVEDLFNVSRAISADVWRGCCETLSITNTSDQPILVQNANIIITRPDLAITR